MKNKDDMIFALIKYEGLLVEDGYLDARKSGEALIGIDEALKYFIFQENPQLKKIDFELPVRIRKGSWETIFPEDINEILIKTSLTWGAAKYFGSALSEMAKNDFKDLGFKDVFKAAFKGMTWVLKIAVHLGTITKKKLENLKFSKDNSTVGITNEKGNVLWVPVEFVELFSNCPSKLFINLARVIEEERELEVSYNETDSKKEIARVDKSSKFIFMPNEEDDEILFPDLKHNDYVELDGHITRGNENSNTIGFYYRNHVLTCFPNQGNIISFKDFLFSNCTLKGFVDRLDKDGEIKEKRPRIKFLEITSNEPENSQTKLFE